MLKVSRRTHQAHSNWNTFIKLCKGIYLMRNFFRGGQIYPLKHTATCSFQILCLRSPKGILSGTKPPWSLLKGRAIFFVGTPTFFFNPLDLLISPRFLQFLKNFIFTFSSTQLQLPGQQIVSDSSVYFHHPPHGWCFLNKWSGSVCGHGVVGPRKGVSEFVKSDAAPSEQQNFWSLVT